MLIKAGITSGEIADRIGCARGTLRVVCSKAKISLRKSGSHERALVSDSTPDRTHYAPIPVKLPDVAVGRLRHEAGKRGLAAATFATMLLEIIAQDNVQIGIGQSSLGMSGGFVSRRS